MPSLPLVLAAESVTTKLLSLSLPDLVIIVAYFAMVLGIGWYLKRQTQTGEDFFLAGREMTAWIAGLSFLSANLGSLELMGWAGRRTSTESWRPTGTGSAPSRPCSSSAS